MLKKAIEIDPASDAAATAHIFLAQAYVDLGKRDDALRLNPERRFAQPI